MIKQMLVLVIHVFLSIAEQYSSNYSIAKVTCHNRAGLFTRKLLKLSGLLNITCELGVNNSVLKDGESVWVQGHAHTGPYISLHTCMRFSGRNKYTFVRNMTFHSNILYECSLFCVSTGYLGIFTDSCFCMSESFRFPHTPECLENDFLDTHNGILVFKLTAKQPLEFHSESANFNCLGASFQGSGKTSYFKTKCASMLYSICTHRVDSYLSKDCLPRLSDFCLNEESSTLLEHYRKCWLYNGTLISFKSGLEVSLNNSVMLGSFRAFKAIEDDGENDDKVTLSCLSVTKFDGTVYLDTENCSNENAFICMDDIQETSNKEESETTHTVPNIKLTLIGISIVIALIAIAIAFVVWWKLRRRRQCRGTSQSDSSQQSDEHENTSPRDEIPEEYILLNVLSLSTEAEHYPSQRVPEAQQSKHIYSRFQTQQDEDDDTYDSTRTFTV